MPPGARQQVVLHQDVIGDRDHVELAGRSVEVDDFGDRQLAVAPLACGRGSHRDRKGSYPGMQSDLSHVEMRGVLGPVMQNLRREVADVETEDRALPHRHVAARRGVEVAVVEEADASDGKQPPADVGVLAVKLDRGVEPADARQRVGADGEVAAVEDRADAQDVFDEQLRRRRQREVVGADEQSSPPVPVVEAIRPGQRNEIGIALRIAARRARARSAAPGNRHPRRRARRPVAIRRPVSRATTRPLRGSSTTRTCGICSATARVASVLALLMTRISSGSRDCARREWRHAARYCASLWAQTMTLNRQRHACAPPTDVPWYTHVHTPKG